MKRGAWVPVNVFCVLVFLGIAATSEAVFPDEKQTLQFTAKAQTRATIRLNDAQGFTFPDVRIGDLVQHHNLMVLEVDHNLYDLKERVDLLYPLQALELEAKYRIVGRFM